MDHFCHQDWETVVLTKTKYSSKDELENKASIPKSSKQKLEKSEDIHIPDKVEMARQAFRVLKPGGKFAASDWLISHEGSPSLQMEDYIKAEGLDFAMASPKTYLKAMQNAGFVDVELVNRNPWYAKIAAKELAWLTGSNRTKLSERHGTDYINHQIEIWDKLVGVLESGEHCPHHIRARKPA